MKNILKVVLICFGLVACTTPDIPDRPTYFSFESDSTEVKQAIVAAFSARQFQIVSDSQFQMVMDQTQIGNAADLLYGSSFSPNPNGRVIMVFTGQSPVTIQTRTKLVTNPGTSFEIIRDWEDKVFKNRIFLTMQEAKITLNE